MTTVRLKRGDDTSVPTYTGPAGELIYNVDTSYIHVQDGTTAGGTPLTPLSELDARVPATITVGETTADLYYLGLTALTGLESPRVMTATLIGGVPVLLTSGPTAVSSATSSPPNDSGLYLTASAGSLTSADKPTSNTTNYWVVNLRMLNERFSYASRQAVDALDPGTATLADLITALQS